MPKETEKGNHAGKEEEDVEEIGFDSHGERTFSEVLLRLLNVCLNL